MALSVKSIAIGVVVLVLIILIIRWIMGDSTKLSGLNDAKKVTKISAQDLAQNNASNYAYSVWFYVDDWSYRYGEPKIILGRLDSDLNPSPSITLGAIENNLQIETTVYPSSQSSTGTKNTCNVANVPIQKWVNVIVSLYGRTMDVYIDGKLVRTCVLPGVAKIANNAPVYVTPLGGFSGYTANIHYYADALNPQEAYNIYRMGYGGSGMDFPYEVKIEFLKDGEEQGTLTL
jgi:hypothetical protein